MSITTEQIKEMKSLLDDVFCKILVLQEEAERVESLLSELEKEHEPV